MLVELAGIMHLPNPEIPSERLLRVRTQTRQPARASHGGLDGS